MKQAVDWILLNYDFFSRSILPEDTSSVPGCFSHLVHQHIQTAGFILSNVALGKAVKRAAREQGVDDLWKTIRMCDDLKRKVPNWVNMKRKAVHIDNTPSSKTEGLMIKSTLFADGPPNYTINDGHIVDFLLDSKCQRRDSHIIVKSMASNPLMKNFEDEIPVHVYFRDSSVTTSDELLLDLGWFYVVKAAKDSSMEIYATYTLARQKP